MKVGLTVKATFTVNSTQDAALCIRPDQPGSLLLLELSLLLNKKVLQPANYFSISSLQNVKHASFRLQVLHLLAELGFMA